MWTDYHLRAESEEAFLAATPEEWKGEDGALGGEGVAVDVIGLAGDWFLVNLRMREAPVGGLAGMVIPPPQHPRRVFA